ncbi:MAG: SpoIIE family protein phosphatase [Coriobacteriia bacterium]|nr:SpoIIE family protein phosphatase [Coriobacteriia bacterium]
MPEGDLAEGVLPQALLRAALETSGSGVAVVRAPDLTCVYANEECERLARTEGMAGRALADSWPDLARRGLLSRLVETLRRGGTFRAEEQPFVLPGPNGTPTERLLTFDGSGVEVEGVPYAVLSVSDVTGRARAEDALRQTVRLQDALTHINEVIQSERDIEEILDHVVRMAAEALGAGSGAVALRDEEGWFVRTVHGFPPEARGNRLPQERMPHGVLAAEADEVVAVEDASADPRTERGLMEEHGITSVIVIPLRMRGEPTGLLFCNWHGDRHRFTDAEVRFAVKFGASVSLAIDNAARLRAEETARAAVAEELRTVNALLEAAEALNASFGLEQVLATLLRVVRRVCRQCCVTVSVLDARTGSVRTLAAEGVACPGGGRPVEELSPEMRRAIEEGRTAVLSYVEQDSSPEARRIAEEHGVVNLLFVPLGMEGDRFGYIKVFDPGHKTRFTEREARLASAIASEAAVAVRHAMLVQEMRETARLGEALDGINQILHATLDPHELLEHSVALAADVLHAPVGGALLFNGERASLAVSKGVPHDQARALESTLSDASATEEALRKGEPLPMDRVDRESRVDGERLELLELRSLILLPLKARSRSFGVQFFGHREPHTFGDAEVDFARKLAASLSLALESARLYEGERFIAETLQESLLSLPEDVEGVELAHLYHSATESARVGGDFYDVFELAHGLVGVLIGDVSGKGVDAAVLTSLVKNTVRAHAREPGRTPAEAVRLTNDAVFRESAPESFVTLFFGMLDRRDGRFVYCNAAHTTALLRRREGTVCSLGPNSPMVGAFDAVGFSQSETLLETGDTLYLYTDGLTEARRGKTLFGEERLVEAVARMPEAYDMWARARGVLEEVLRFSDGHLDDDLALLVVRRTGAPVAAAAQQKFVFDGG